MKDGMVFEKVIVIGSGKIASECIGLLTNHTDRIIGFEHEKQPLSCVKSACRQNNIEYSFIESKEAVSEYLRGLSEKTLIVSANNNFIFKKDVLCKKNLKIINFHNALLPKHCGRNAPTWAIFEMDPFTGVTWHEVDCNIDTGNIIIQKKIPIDSRTTALQLTRTCMETGIAAFAECIGSVLNEEYVPIRQDKDAESKMHCSRSIPNDGMMDFSWEIEKISAFLRSMDYGKYRLFPAPVSAIMGKQYSVTNYAIEDACPDNCRRMTFEAYDIVFTNNGMSISIKLSPVQA